MRPDNTSETSDSLAAQDILEMAKGQCKPRVSLARMAKARAEETRQDSPVPVSDMNNNAMRLVMLTIAVPFSSTSGYYDLLDLNYREGNAAKTHAMGNRNF